MLSNKEIKKQMYKGNIEIENIAPDALKKPNSCDIRLGNILYTYDYSIVDLKESKKYLDEVMNDKTEYLKKIIIPETGLLLQPHKIYLAKSIEKVTTHGYIPVMNGKTSISLLGLSTEHNNGFKNDNYSDYLLLSIIATKPTIIYPDIKIGNLCFFPSLQTSSNVFDGYGTYDVGMLSGKEILRQMAGENPNIIINPKDNIVINPNSVNLTLNNVIGVYSDPILDMKKDNAVEKMEVEDGMWLYPDEVYLGLTNEWTETYNLVPMMSGRSSLGRNGLYVHCSGGMGSVGFKGNWHMGIRVVRPIKVVKDMKCCQIYYYTLEGEALSPYNGTMQNLPEDCFGSQSYRKLKR